MKKHKCFILFLIALLAFTCAGCNGNSQSSVESELGDLTQYLGMSIDDFTEIIDEEVEVTEEEDGPAGYPERGYFEIIIGGVMVYGDLTLDYYKNHVLDDQGLYIQHITVELPYENHADIRLNDSIETAEKKLDAAGIEYSMRDEETICYSYEEIGYFINFFNDGKRAAQFGCMDNDGSIERWRDYTFKKMCALVPDGYYLQNGDYIVALEKGLLTISIDQPSYYLDEDMPGGSLSEVSGALIFTDKDGYEHTVDQSNGTLEAGQVSTTDGQGGVSVATKGLLDILQQKVNEYGYPPTLIDLDYSGRNVLYAKLIDFTGDGQDELFIAYNIELGIAVEVWGWDGTKAQLLFNRVGAEKKQWTDEIVCSIGASGNGTWFSLEQDAKGKAYMVYTEHYNDVYDEYNTYVANGSWICTKEDKNNSSIWEYYGADVNFHPYDSTESVNAVKELLKRNVATSSRDDAKENTAENNKGATKTYSYVARSSVTKTNITLLDQFVYCVNWDNFTQWDQDHYNKTFAEIDNPNIKLFRLNLGLHADKDEVAYSGAELMKKHGLTRSKLIEMLTDAGTNCYPIRIGNKTVTFPYSEDCKITLGPVLDEMCKYDENIKIFNNNQISIETFMNDYFDMNPIDIEVKKGKVISIIVQFTP